MVIVHMFIENNRFVQISRLWEFDIEGDTGLKCNEIEGFIYSFHFACVIIALHCISMPLDYTPCRYIVPPCHSTATMYCQIVLPCHWIVSPCHYVVSLGHIFDRNSIDSIGSFHFIRPLRHLILPHKIWSPLNIRLPKVLQCWGCYCQINNNHKFSICSGRFHDVIIVKREMIWRSKIPISK